MTELKRRLVDRVAEESFAADLASKSMEDLRTMREEASEAEGEVSFERRLCQGRVDILTAELDRRSGKETGDLLSRLPQILAEERNASTSDMPLPDRAPTLTIPSSAGVARRRVEEIAGEQILARLDQIPDDEIRTIIDSLGEHEKRLSTARKKIHDAIDSIQAEIVRRYTSGEEDPSALLK
jgi:hypothetical protein